jgi:hypothetical protein
MNNPPAFPTNQYANGISPSGFDTGMTLRDYFAAKAMQAYLNGHDRDSFTFTEWALTSYAMADAMLKARET